MKESDFIKIWVWEDIIDPEANRVNKEIVGIVEVPIAFVSEGRISRTTGHWLKWALEQSKESGKSVEVHFK